MATIEPNTSNTTQDAVSWLRLLKLYLATILTSGFMVWLSISFLSHESGKKYLPIAFVLISPIFIYLLWQLAGELGKLPICEWVSKQPLLGVYFFVFLGATGIRRVVGYMMFILSLIVLILIYGIVSLPFWWFYENSGY